MKSVAQALVIVIVTVLLTMLLLSIGCSETVEDYAFEPILTLVGETYHESISWGSAPRSFYVDAGKPVGGTGLDTTNAWTSTEDAFRDGHFIPDDTPFVRDVRYGQFTVSEVAEEEPAKDMGLEPVIIIPRHDDWQLWAIMKARARADSSGGE